MPQTNSDIPILIIGAGKAGELIGRDIQNSEDSPFKIVGYLDDDKKKANKKIGDSPVLGTLDDIERVVRENDIQEIFISIPSERGDVVRKIIESTAGQRLVYKILPRQPQVLMQSFSKGYLSFIRKVRVEDLLGGVILKSDQKDITTFVRPQTVLITGAAGSIGSELSRQISAHKARKIIFYDWWENGTFDLRNELIAKYPNHNFEFIIGDVKDKAKINKVIDEYRPDTIFHAAAYKHVPLMEDNPQEAIKNNIIGTRTVADAAIRYGVKKFILVSSDKAVNPTNVMGATKRAAEKMIHILAESQDTTIFSAVRFGNVINSNGSAIPIFNRQIENGGPVTVTHKEMTRYFMTIPEAVHLILQSWVMGENNDLFVLDMGEPVKIYELAKLLINLAGYVPEEDIQIKIVGMRPGEKLYEEVLVDQEEVTSTHLKKVFKTKNYMNFDKLNYLHNLDSLMNLLEDDELNDKKIKENLQKLISTYKPAKNGR